jgi:hypothetical protein
VSSLGNEKTGRINKKIDDSGTDQAIKDLLKTLFKFEKTHADEYNNEYSTYYHKSITQAMKRGNRK